MILSTPRTCLGHQCKARFAGNGRSLAKKRNTAVMAQVRPNVNIILTCLLTSLLGACAVQPSPDSALTEKMIGQEWQLAKVSHNGLELKVDPAIAAFTLHISAEGQASGRVACNRWRGPATLEGGKLSISPAASTRARCNTSEAQHQELERRYLASLKEPLGWRVDGKQLILDISANERWVYTWP